MMLDIQSAISSQTKGHSLERRFYTCPDIYQHDIEHIFKQQWLFVAPLAAFKKSGDYITFSLNRSPIAVIQDDEGEIRAFHNVCRHRGSVILQQARGNIRHKLVCPYHQWTYEKNGTLAAASHVKHQPDPQSHSLLPIQTAILGGGVHICLAENPPPIAPAIADFNAHTAIYDCQRQKIVIHSQHIVDANWKLVVENNRECGHCRGAHPELMTCVFDFGMGDDHRNNPSYCTAEKQMQEYCQANHIPHQTLDFPNDSFYRLARLPFKKDFLSEVTKKSQLACQKLLGRAQPDIGQLRGIALPNLWGHYLADYNVFTRLLPLAPLQSQLDIYWTVHEDAVEGCDYKIPDLTEVWEATTAQDAQLVNNNQKGVLSDYYRPGPYSPITESFVSHFTEWYLQRIG